MLNGRTSTLKEQLQIYLNSPIANKDVKACCLIMPSIFYGEYHNSRGPENLVMYLLNSKNDHYPQETAGLEFYHYFTYLMSLVFDSGLICEKCLEIFEEEIYMLGWYDVRVARVKAQEKNSIDSESVYKNPCYHELDEKCDKELSLSFILKNYYHFFSTTKEE